MTTVKEQEEKCLKSTEMLAVLLSVEQIKFKIVFRAHFCCLNIFV